MINVFNIRIIWSYNGWWCCFLFLLIVGNKILLMNLKVVLLVMVIKMIVISLVFLCWVSFRVDGCINFISLNMKVKMVKNISLLFIDIKMVEVCCCLVGVFFGCRSLLVYLVGVLNSFFVVCFVFWFFNRVVMVFFSRVVLVLVVVFWVFSCLFNWYMKFLFLWVNLVFLNIILVFCWFFFRCWCWCCLVVVFFCFCLFMVVFF